MIPDDGIPAPQVAEPKDATVTLNVSERQALRLGEIADLLAEIGDHGTSSVNAAGTLLLALSDPGTMALVRRVAHQLRVRAGTA